MQPMPIIYSLNHIHEFLLVSSTGILPSLLISHAIDILFGLSIHPNTEQMIFANSLEIPESQDLIKRDLQIFF